MTECSRTEINRAHAITKMDTASMAVSIEMQLRAQQDCTEADPCDFDDTGVFDCWLRFTVFICICFLRWYYHTTIMTECQQVF